jgi:hypothetical protein
MSGPIALAALEQARNLLPELRAAPGPVRRSLKCIAIPAAIGTRQVVVKVLVRSNPVWRWYFERERAIYEQFERAAPPLDPVQVPRLVAHSGEFLVIDRMPGEPLARWRHDAGTVQLDSGTWEALVGARERLSRWVPAGGFGPRHAPGGALVAAMRRRLLEDPSEPVGWIAHGIERLRRPSPAMLDAQDAERMVHALSEHPATCSSHGDLLLRNVLSGGGGRLSLVDWECAGEHAEAWDPALLWVFAPEWARRRLEMEPMARPESWRAFLSCVAFALSREVFYRSAQGRGLDPVAGRLLRDRERVLAELRDSRR